MLFLRFSDGSDGIKRGANKKKKDGRVWCIRTLLYRVNYRLYLEIIEAFGKIFDY